MPKIFSKDNTLILLGVLIAAQFVFLGFILHDQKNTNHLYGQEINGLEQNTNTVSTSLSYEPVTISPTNDRIYFPQLSLSIPITPLGATLVYRPDTAYVTGSYKIPTGPFDEAEVSTFTTANTKQTQSQFDCSGLVRIKFEPKPNPYNPNEIPSGSISLANGKTLQVYAYHLKACQAEWTFAQANPDTIAALFKQAQSY